MMTPEKRRAAAAQAELQSWLETINFRRRAPRLLAAAERFGATRPHVTAPKWDGYGFIVTW